MRHLKPNTADLKCVYSAEKEITLNVAKKGQNLYFIFLGLMMAPPGSALIQCSSKFVNKDRCGCAGLLAQKVKITGYFKPNLK